MKSEKIGVVDVGGGYRGVYAVALFFSEMQFFI